MRDISDSEDGQIMSLHVRRSGASIPAVWEEIRGTPVPTVGIDDRSHNLTTTGRGEMRLKDGALLTVSGGQRQTTYGTGMTHPSLEYMTLVWDKKYSKESSLKFTWAENWFENMDVGTYDYRSRQDLLEIQNTLNWDTHKIVWGGDYTRDAIPHHHTRSNQIPQRERFDR